MHVVHLNKSGSGMTSKTACGRNILRTPMSVNWTGFKDEPAQFRCIKCAESKQFEVNTKMDVRNALTKVATEMGKLQFIHIG